MSNRRSPPPRGQRALLGARCVRIKHDLISSWRLNAIILPRDIPPDERSISGLFPSEADFCGQKKAAIQQKAQTAQVLSGRFPHKSAEAFGTSGIMGFDS